MDRSLIGLLTFLCIKKKIKNSSSQPFVLPSFLLLILFIPSVPVDTRLVNREGAHLSRQIAETGLTVGLHVATLLQPIFCI